MINAVELGNRLRTLREERGEDQAVVAEAAGISRSHLANIERGRDRPGRQTMMMIANHYGVSLDWLTADEGEQQSVDKARAANENEALLLYAFRQLPPDEAQSILKLLMHRTKQTHN